MSQKLQTIISKIFNESDTFDLDKAASALRKAFQAKTNYFNSENWLEPLPKISIGIFTKFPADVIYDSKTKTVELMFSLGGRLYLPKIKNEADDMKRTIKLLDAIIKFSKKYPDAVQYESDLISLKDLLGKS